jgi:hypothetical protein
VREVTIAQAMDELAGVLAAKISRPVTTDPRNLVAPCVLIEPPQLTPDGTYCGTRKYTWSLLAIGLPGARAEFGVLSDLTEEVLGVLDETGWTWAELVAYVPGDGAGGADPVMAYRITMEDYR